MTAAERAAAASALGITVKAWHAGRQPAFDNVYNGSTCAAACSTNKG